MFMEHCTIMLYMLSRMYRRTEARESNLSQLQMNIFPPSTERDQGYKVYFSNFKSAGRQISSDIGKTALNDWMQNIVIKFPYFVHTNPKTMVIASYILSLGKGFSHQQVVSLIASFFPNVTGDR